MDTKESRPRAAENSRAHHIASHEAIDALRDAIAGAGLTPPDQIIADGTLRRFASSGKRGDDSGWYVAHLDGMPAGAFGDWRSGVNETWTHRNGREYTPAERAEYRSRIEAAQRLRAVEEDRRHDETAGTAAQRWAEAKPADPGHAYLTAKGVAPHGIRQGGDELLIPVRINGALRSLQTIKPDGSKRFLAGGEVVGGYYSIGGRPERELLICEGLATGASLFEATGYPVAIAFNAGNLEAVATVLRAKYPTARLIVCADDDARTDGNPGVSKATAAACAVGGLIAFPDFGGDRPDGATDFNDLCRLRGAEAVRVAVERAQMPGIGEHGSGDAGEPWPKPEPLTVRIESEPYPADALPGLIGAAVAEVQAFVQAPLPLVACSALSALSVAIQAHYDVKRTDRLQGPVSLFLLAIADSGERKTTVDGFFTAAIRKWEAGEASAAAPDQRKHRADVAVWEAKRQALLDLIRSEAKKRAATTTKEDEMGKLEAEKPEPPRVPRLMLGDETPENLAWTLAKQWPSGGVISSEAGVVFGAHGMNRDSIVRNLALLNMLWDGGELSIGRRTSDSFTVRGARLTVGLQIQEATLREFFAQSRGLARGTGFLARFLIAWPASTQGSRPFREAPPRWPALAAFDQRLTALLDASAPINEAGELAPQELELAPDAQAAWIVLHDAIEAELRDGGELADVKDVASKAADNAARLAALFHVFEGGTGPVSLSALKSASRIVAWHLSEARRFFGELALPAELADATRLDEWLLAYCRRERVTRVPVSAIQKSGPGRLREKAKLEPALAELDDLGRVRVIRDGRAKTIDINPALLSEGGAP